ncbi:glycosyltransferase [uncultured Gimesia sp.]|uniref:glycosyltransferase n=1 Tax=uncultured Gimesia sp. TaxID=1678688 RepID=UPI0030DB6D37|tara:strand:+ start:4585 stop:5616 length:1032 start_codon:yes stop_codon:yes gene_type:complete
MNHQVITTQIKDKAANDCIAVVIPCYKVHQQILDVISKIGSECSLIYVVDDCCPEHTGKLVESTVTDERVHVIYHAENEGVGGAVISGYRAAIANGADIIVKVDGDGQMDPRLIPSFVEPILSGEADYTKGNRFYLLEEIRAMPKIRLWGNSILSFMSKVSTGYWNLFDPTNGYTAIHAEVARYLPFRKISKRYFFETDMLFRLNTSRAVVVDIPMHARYEDEESNLKISTVITEFFYKHLRNIIKRIFYNYYLRDLSLASFELVLGCCLFTFGFCFGIYSWLDSLALGTTTSAGTVMLAALPILMGLQFILAFLGYDISRVPSQSIHKKLSGWSCIIEDESK